jgi:hypothetical protein
LVILSTGFLSSRSANPTTFMSLELDPKVRGCRAEWHASPGIGLTAMAKGDVETLATFVTLASIQLALRRLARA